MGLAFVRRLRSSSSPLPFRPPLTSMATHFLCCGHYSQKKKPWSCVVRMVSIEAEKPPTDQMRPTSDTGLKAVKEIKNGTFFILTCVLTVPLTAGDRIVGLCSGECQPGRLSSLLNGLFVCLARHTEMAEEMKIHSSSEQLPTEWRAICWVPVEFGLCFSIRPDRRNGNATILSRSTLHTVDAEKEKSSDSPEKPHGK